MSTPAAPRPAAAAGDEPHIDAAIDPASALSGPARSAVRSLGRSAASQGTPIYFVGGLPRDLVLGEPIGTDLDIVAVGDAVALARAVVATAGGALTIHPRFGTATWRIDDVSIDLVTARSEHYPRPAALPVIAPGTLEEDLARRDFSVNTLALAIEGEGFGPVIDRHGGLRDLRGRVVRVLHEGSFVDDPTRIFRAVRTEVRFGMAMDSATERWARAAARGIRALSGKRVLAELRVLFEHPNAEAALRRLADLGVLDGLGPAPLSAYDVPPLLRTAPDDSTRAFDALGGAPSALLRLIAWLAANGPAGVQCGLRLRLGAAMQRDLTTAVALSCDGAIADPTARTSAINAAIARHRPTPAALDVAATSAADRATRARLVAYAAFWRSRPAPLDGDDIVALGVTPGPAVGALLDAVRRAWWDGEIAGRDDAIVFVRRRMATPAEAGREGADG